MRDIPISKIIPVAFLLAVVSTPGQSIAADNDRCPRLVAEHSPAIVLASLRIAQLAAEEVRLTFIGHSTFLIESPKGVRIATDYNDYVRPNALPDIITMNRAHSTHFTNYPDPEIKYVLRGWGDNGEPARHEFSHEDIWIRNVVTNIRDWSGGTIPSANSIFVFEISGVCIAHLGHLHHTLTQEHLDRLGRIDVLLVPVDGSYTLGVDGMIEVISQIKPRLIIPMHIFGPSTLERFAERVRTVYPVEINETPAIVLNRATLPSQSKMIVLPGR
jgi:L-ascorbate metabolism protein UlaG (beta-lactamase superfamily)